MCLVGYLPLTLATILVLPADSQHLRDIARHGWLWSSLGDRLSLPILLVHNSVCVLVEGVVFPGPSWDYPFSWFLWAACLLAVLVASWISAFLAHGVVLGPCAML